MLVSPRKNGLTSLFKEVRVFKVFKVHPVQFGALPAAAEQLFTNQEPRKGGFSKGDFCRVECHAQGNKKYPRILGPAVHLALTATQPREAYILRKTAF